MKRAIPSDASASGFCTSTAAAVGFGAPESQKQLRSPSQSRVTTAPIKALQPKPLRQLSPFRRLKTMSAPTHLSRPVR